MTRIILASFIVVVTFSLKALTIISGTKTTASFSLVAKGKAAPLYMNENDYTIVAKTMGFFQLASTGVTHLLSYKIPVEKNIIIAGTINRSGIIAKLV